MASEAQFDNWQRLSGVAPQTVIQVKHTLKTDTWSGSGSGTSWLDTDFNCSITPTSASSKILLMCRLFIGTQYWEVQGKFQRNGVDIGLGDQRGSRSRCGFATLKYDAANDFYDWHPVSYTLLDTPQTTANVNYRLFLNPYAANLIHINRTHTDTDDQDYHGRTSSSITLMEIA
jgi:hypothetical protein